MALFAPRTGGEHQRQRWRHASSRARIIDPTVQQASATPGNGQVRDQSRGEWAWHPGAGFCSHRSSAAVTAAPATPSFVTAASPLPNPCRLLAVLSCSLHVFQRRDR
ncbi:hypothetical protein MRX96_038242 [Rhipicephalus microplus]